jgi:hypothetical protein
MKLSVRIDASLPQLAWLAEIDREALDVRATIGSSVEVASDFLVAGVWDGRFADGRFDTTECFFGTGLVTRSGSVVLVPSAALTDAVYYRELGARIVAANSLSLLLAATGDRLDPQFPTYQSITESLQAGLDAALCTIPTKRGSINRLLIRNLRVTTTTIEEFNKDPPPAFPDFATYLAHVSNRYTKICRNIRAYDRQHPLDLISTQSRGYDTSAVNSIAARHGLEAVFTISEAKQAGAFVGRSSRRGKSDDGSEICAALGLPVTRLERLSFTATASFDDECLFYAASNHAEAVSLRDLKRYLRRPSVMLTGVRGDVVWATDQYYLARPWLLKAPDHARSGREKRAEVTPEMLPNDLRGPDTWLFGMSEIGLDWGLIQLAPSYIGARNQPDIFRITMSDEMRPWRVGGEYDRPIARRIAEEIGGIPRTLFAREKMATVTEFPLPPVPVEPRLRHEYFVFLGDNRIASRLWRVGYRLAHYINARIVYHTPRRYRYLYYLRRVLARLARREVNLPILGRRLDGALYCFCVNKRAAEYDAILARSRIGQDSDALV